MTLECSFIYSSLVENILFIYLKSLQIEASAAFVFEYKTSSVYSAAPLLHLHYV